MMRAERGTALAETALVVGLALVIVFNAIELALFGFFQLHSDATAFAAARYVAQGGAQGNFPAASFPPALAPDFAGTAGSVVQAKASKDPAATLMLFPGAGDIRVWGEHQENLAAASTSGVPGFSISESLQQLVNYYASGIKQATAPTVHRVCLAHTVSTNSNGNNGTNGAFKIFNDHATTFKTAYVELPSSWNAQTNGTLSPTWQRGVKGYSKNQSTIDGWDTSATSCTGPGV